MVWTKYARVYIRKDYQMAKVYYNNLTIGEVRRLFNRFLERVQIYRLLLTQPPDNNIKEALSKTFDLLKTVKED